jgi:hypothetical protein
MTVELPVLSEIDIPVKKVHITLDTLRVTDTELVTLGWNFSMRYTHRRTLVTMETSFLDNAFCTSAPLKQRFQK